MEHFIGLLSMAVGIVMLLWLGRPQAKKIVPVKKVYLAGPIAGKTDAECNGWRDQVIAALGKGQTLNPMLRDFRGIEGDHTEEIVEGDLEDIDKCDAVLVYYTGPTAGTCMEMFYAFREEKTVVTVDVSGKPLSPWVKYHSDVIVESIEEGIDELEREGFVRKPRD